MHRIIIVGFALVLLLAIACKETSEGDLPANAIDSDMLGSWTGRLELTDQDFARMGDITPEMKAEIEDSARQHVFKLKLRGDGTYSMTRNGEAWEDTWEIDGDDIVLASRGVSTRSSRNVKTGESSRSIEPNKQPVTLEISSDRAELRTRGFSGPIPSVVFRRE